TKKREILFPRQIAHYQLAEENKKIFKKEYWSLIARLFGMKVSTVIHSYSMIDGWKNLPTPEGREIREVLGLFKNHWISYRK
ncbi:MAG: hypothetical protein Q8Q86_01080, partial [Candidatus Daviesbacteria bacterium]|nr:hypothetical protein [Candidatus Daviesbacteria bacterium]